MSYVCKQTQPLLSSHLHEKCLVKLLQPRGSARPPPPPLHKRWGEILELGLAQEQTKKGFILSPQLKVPQ
jgi:hypothetical protein